jgi:hypothetical protein
MTRDELLKRISSEELTEWIALYHLRAEEREQAQAQRARR